MASRHTGNRLARYSDPEGINQRSPQRPMKAATAAADGATLLRAAAAHNVLPSVARNLAQEMQRAPQAVIAGSGDAVDALRQRLVADARQTSLGLVARNMVLADIARDMLAAAARDDVPVILVKGLDFAEACYGGLPMRAFSDIDLLVHPDAAWAVAGMLVERGFAPVAPTAKRESYTERQFVCDAGEIGPLLAEVHTDLAHAPKLRRRTSLTYDTYAGAASGGVTMAARLILAGIHGSTSHLFERLQYMTDILAIVRRGVDPAELRERVAETGSLLAVRTGLDLTGRIFDCPGCGELLAALPSARHGWLASRLLTPATVVSAFGPTRAVHSWRRQVFRVLMTRPTQAA
jgi:Uncharacterised nucleotidyltransferase